MSEKFKSSIDNESKSNAFDKLDAANNKISSYLDEIKKLLAESTDRVKTEKMIVEKYGPLMDVAHTEQNEAWAEWEEEAKKLKS